ncbi:CBS domain-containing protein [Halovulum dunhuangense]|uniref:CBS domain-containing protein n=1 Tax=Halovulum dunhuangense TaxID=1505036 RepID=A0A849L5U3_9RHOB|nr:HPP family protein [Halovulum dunhuangense]NNU81765.1 CBS domain-containing protein [Halovulum dunhuangense]
MPRPNWREALRSGLGAGLALGLCGAILVLLEAWHGEAARFLLIAPLGATAFLVFAVPNSPLAQPWSAIVGNAASALVAIGVTGLGLAPELSAGLAVLAAMLSMAVLRAMHPPGAAVALATVLSTPAGVTHGLGFVLSPVMLDTALLVALAVLYNRATGRKYPFRQPAVAERHATMRDANTHRLGLSSEDLAAVLDRFNLSANIGAEDFGRILAAAEAEAARRHFKGLTCGAVMSGDVVSVTPDTRARRVADLFRKHRFKTLPVVDTDGTLRGIITQNDLIQRARLDATREGRGFAAAMTNLLAPGGDRRLCACDIMTTELCTVRPTDGIGVLVQLLADGRVQAAPVVEGSRLAGIVTRSDLVAVLARQTILAGGLQTAA